MICLVYNLQQKFKIFFLAIIWEEELDIIKVRLYQKS